jgi:hypothetical protein
MLLRLASRVASRVVMLGIGEYKQPLLAMEQGMLGKRWSSGTLLLPWPVCRHIEEERIRWEGGMARQPLDLLALLACTTAVVAAVVA